MITYNNVVLIYFLYNYYLYSESYINPQKALIYIDKTTDYQAIW